MTSPSQRWNPETYAKHARYVSDLGAGVVALLAPRPGERILDLGCGDGVLTAQLILAGCEVVGIDSSDEQVAAARARGLDARVGRAESLPFNEEFDAVFSNAALHWVRDASAAAASVYHALKPGGRFVGEMGGSGNVQTIRRALGEAMQRHGVDAGAVDPWILPSVEQYRRVLGGAGFEIRSMNLFPRPTPLPTGMEGWLNMFAQPFLAALDAADRQQVIDEVCSAVRPELHDAEQGWFADYVRLRFFAERPPPGAIGVQGGGDHS